VITHVGRFDAGDDLLGFFLAGVPFLVLGSGRVWNDFGPKPVRTPANAQKLLKTGDTSELANSERGLPGVKTGLHCSCSKWLGERAL